MKRLLGPVVASATAGLAVGLVAGRRRAPVGSSPSASLDSARATLQGMRGDLADIASQRCVPGSAEAAAALLTGVAAAIGSEADEALRTGVDSVGESLVFLLSNVLDTVDNLRGVETA